MTPRVPGDAPPDVLLRDLAPQVLGVVLRRVRDFAAAEDAVQEALLAAAVQWPRDGIPDNPRAWLIQVACRRVTDHLRSESARRRREAGSVFLLAREPAPHCPPLEPEHDDTLTLLFLCCHPVLTSSSAIALTLRAAGGLTTAEIASAFLVPESTMAQRISRAKQTIKASGVPFERPSGPEHARRLGLVLHVLYLIFNEGYTASSGSGLVRPELSSEAIRLARVVRGLLPADSEVAGLLALMLLTDARRAARTTPAGDLIPLTEQDRALWDRRQIAEGTGLLTEALSRGSAGPYQLQAAIAALHDEAASAAQTDWPQILALYELLLRMADNPMVALNHAVAAAVVRGPAAGLDFLNAIESRGKLAGHHRLAAVRAHLLELAGDRPAAVAQYRLAASRTTSLPEQNYLLTRAARLAEDRNISNLSPSTSSPPQESNG